ncbi:MAG: hypothetical protein M1818_002267 [Claussenomyces sp. TS43310]|nr:MAG: hypothetical protein M1818_002267 [Claussenomyces sp. TS43310]
MRRISRFNDAVRRAHPSTYTTSLSSSCRRQAAPFSASARQAAEAKAPLTDRLRKRIWGTDRPPGLKDPYSPAADQAPEEEHRVVESAEAQARKREHEAMMETYVPATTWEGLDSIGGYGNWWRDNWDPEHQFDGFLPGRRVTESYEMTAALHRSVVEVFTLLRASRPLSHFSHVVGPDQTSSVQVTSTATGTILSFESVSPEEIVQSLTPAEQAPTESEADVAADRSSEDPLHPAVDETAVKINPTESEEDVAADRSTEDPLTDAGKTHEAAVHQRQLASWDPSWLQVSLHDPAVKFAVLKRTMQLTGHRIPDAAINTVSTVQDVLNQLITPPKPRRLAEALELKEELVSLPNVKISGRRITPIDKEVSAGRWKVIEKELESRGLPVTGH